MFLAQIRGWNYKAKSRKVLIKIFLQVVGKLIVFTYSPPPEKPKGSSLHDSYLITAT